MIKHKESLVLYLDSTEKSDELNEYFDKEGHDTVKREHVEDVVDVLKSQTDAYSKTVLIWHLTSLCFGDNYIEDDDELKSAVQYFKDNLSIVLDFKLAVSDNHNFYNAAKEISWFDFADSWYQLRTLFKIKDGYSLVKGLKSLPSIKKKDEISNTTSFLRHLFLPIDIDMQALEIIKDDAGKVEKYLWGDKYTDIEGMFEGREGDEHYRQKLYDLWHLLGKQDYLRQIGKDPSSKVEHLAPIDNPSPSLQKLAGLSNGNPKESPIYQFLKALDERKKDGNDLKEEVDYLLTPFKSIELKIGDDEINSFQDWYCALDSCLREAEGCEGK